MARGLEEEGVLLEAIGRGEYCCLRHGLPYVRVSMLVSQLVCERRLDLDLREGLVEVKARELLKLLRPLMDSRRRLLSCSGRRLVVSLPLAAVVEGVPVVGRPDALLVDDCRVSAVIRVKESGRFSRLDEARLRLYGLLLDYSPLPRSSVLRLVQVYGDRECIAEAVLRARESGVEALRGLRGCRASILVYDRGSALSLFSRLAGYWLGARDAVPRPGWPCRECRWRGVCGAGGV